MEIDNFWRLSQNAYESSIRFWERRQAQGVGNWIWGVSAGLFSAVVLCEVLGQVAGHRLWEVTVGLLSGIACIGG